MRRSTALLICLFACGSHDSVDRAGSSAPVNQPIEHGPVVKPDVGDPPPDMVRVKAGSLAPGCVEPSEPSMCDTAVVAVDEFYIDRTEVTVAAYQECVDAGACKAPNRQDCESPPAASSPDVPITCVTTGEALDFCHYRGKRLPIEAEWEWAARGDDLRDFPWGRAKPSCEVAVLSDATCGSRSLAPVGSKPAGASPFGALDMIGNASEIVLMSVASARGQGPSTSKGGSYLYTKDNLNLWDNERHTRNGSVGFRCVRRPTGTQDLVAQKLGI